jgi:hypothetical protein
MRRGVYIGEKIIPRRMEYRPMSSGAKLRKGGKEKGGKCGRKRRDDNTKREDGSSRVNKWAKLMPKILHKK